MSSYLLDTTLAALLISQEHSSAAKASQPSVQIAELPDGIRLHYVEMGAGSSIVFVHGSLSDYDYWSDQIGFFSKRCELSADLRIG
jgi:hypothetical protein